MLAMVEMDEEQQERRKRGGRKGVNWLAAHTFYLSAPQITYVDVAKRFDVSSRSVEKQASKENWRAEREALFGDAQQKLREACVEGAARWGQLHVDRADALLELSAQLESELLADAKMSVRSKIEAYKSLVEATDKAARLGRTVRGLRDGEASEPDVDPDDGKIIIEQRTLEPHKIAVNDNGRAVNQ